MPRPSYRVEKLFIVDLMAYFHISKSILSELRLNDYRTDLSMNVEKSSIHLLEPSPSSCEQAPVSLMVKEIVHEWPYSLDSTSTVICEKASM